MKLFFSMTVGFEPTRENPILLAVRLLNHSDKSSINKKMFQLSILRHASPAREAFTGQSH